MGGNGDRRPPRSRSPSWGAWIEIVTVYLVIYQGHKVAPPRGERGLKFACDALCIPAPRVAPPRGERGLKSPVGVVDTTVLYVAPPRGERGLKFAYGRDLRQ